MTTLFARLASATLCLAGLAFEAPAAALDVPALADHKTWRRLLLVPPGAVRSEVRSPEFFLAPQAAGEPRAELEATLLAWSQAWPEDAQQHPRCRFPARYYWLAQHVSLPGYTEREPRCSGLERWARFDQLRSASVLLVSGYFGNPASTFGHALLRLNTGEPTRDTTLLDLAFNFGALVPPNESMPRYVLQGLTGGYAAAFSDKFFYTQDLVYSRTEFRDVWDYELELSRDQLMLLTLHLYELVGRKFDYYFLTDNCAFRLAQVIELASGHELSSRARLWYAPVELFHRLHEADAARPGKAIRAIRFVPSSERGLHSAFGALSPDERRAANAALDAAPREVERLLGAWPVDRRVAVLDSLISHAQFRHVAEQPSVTLATRERMASLLRQRLSLPPSDVLPDASGSLPSPATASPPMSLSLGLGADRARPGSRLMLRGAVFDYNPLDDHGLLGGELVVLDTQVALGRAGRISLERLDLIRARKLDVSGVDIDGMDRLSWHTVVGLRRFGHLGGDRLRAQVSFGAGAAQRLAPQAVVFALLDAGLLSDPGAAALQPRIGIVGTGQRWRGSLELAWRRESRVDRGRGTAAAELRYQWTPTLAFRGEASRDTRARWSAGLSGSW